MSWAEFLEMTCYILFLELYDLTFVFLEGKENHNNQYYPIATQTQSGPKCHDKPELGQKHYRPCRVYILPF